MNGKSHIDFTSFDYFNFYQDSRLRDLFSQSISLSGVMSSAPRGLGGSSQEVCDLEVAISRHFGLKNSVYFSSRQQAVFSLFTCLLSENDLVIFDEDTTAPVIDACFQVGCHSVGIDLANTDWQLSLVEHARLIKPGGSVYFFFEELSSVTGKFNGLNDTLTKLKYLRITPIIDLTYSFGFSMPDLSISLPPADYFVVGGFGFSFPGMGGFICGDSRIDLIKERSRILQSEIPLPPCAVLFTKLCLPFAHEISFKRTNLLTRVGAFLSEFFTFEEPLLTPLLSLSFDSPVAAKAAVDKFANDFAIVSRVARGKICSEKTLVRLNLSQAHTDLDFEFVRRILGELA